MSDINVKTLIPNLLPRNVATMRESKFVVLPLHHYFIAWLIVERFFSLLILFWYTSIYVETPNFSQTQWCRFGGSATAKDYGWQRHRGCLLLVRCLSCAFSMAVWRWICGVVGIFIFGKMECCRKWIDFSKCSLWLLVDLHDEGWSVNVEVVVLRRLRRGCVVTTWRTCDGWCRSGVTTLRLFLLRLT